MRAIVVRHYKTTSNESDQILGWGDAPPAESWQDDLNKVDEILLGSHITIHHIYTSTLPRAINTGKFYADSYGIKCFRKMNDIIHNLLFIKQFTPRLADIMILSTC